MLSKNLSKARDYVKELNQKLEEYHRFTEQNIPGLFREQRKRKPPKDFNDSSFLYIRAYDGDIGVRPFSNITYWLSPDITVAPVTNTAAYTETLEAGKAYQFSCTVRNRGDLIVPSANVEFFLVNPSLGFDSRFATKLGVTRGWVNSQGATKVAIEATIAGNEGGHKCLFARTFAFSPLDVPFDDYQLYPPFDRHVGQLNLTIIPQATPYSFNLVHLLNATERIAFVPMTAEQVMATRHPFLADFKISERISTDAVNAIKIEPVKQKGFTIKMQKEGPGFNLNVAGKGGMELEQQAQISRSTRNAIEEINGGKAKPAQFKELFKSYREMNKTMQNTVFKMETPNLGLQPGEAAGLQIVNTNLLTGETKGGITMIVKG
jgi:hypothetical protein